MKLKLTLRRGNGRDDDILVETEASTTVGALARAIAERDPRGATLAHEGAEPTLRVEDVDEPRSLEPDMTLAETGMRSGDAISLVGAAERFVDSRGERTATAVLVVTDGPGTGQQFPLHRGANLLGRDPECDVCVDDPMISRRHARLNVSDVLEVLDLGSANGTFVNDEVVHRAVVQPGESISVGTTTLELERIRAVPAAASGNVAEFNRAPYLDPRYEGEEATAPEPPERPKINRFPFVPMLVPMVFGAVLYLVTREAYTLLFAFMGPVLTVGIYWQSQLTTRSEFQEGERQFRAELGHLATRLDEQRNAEVANRRRENPAAEELLAAVDPRGPLLWARRPDRPGFLDLRGGSATLPTRSNVEMPNTNRSTPESRDELLAVVAARSTVPDVPVVASLLDVGAIGVAGPREDAVGMARALLVQLAGLHSPTEVALTAICGIDEARTWDWLKWLPHTTSEQSPIAGDHLAAGAGVANVVSAVEQLIAERAPDPDQPAGDGAKVAVVLLVDDSAPVDRNRLLRIAEAGPPVGVYSIWLSSTPADLPAACRAFFAFNAANGTVGAGFVDGGQIVALTTVEQVTAESAQAFARALAPVRDAASLVDDESDLPSSVSLLDEIGSELASSSAAVVERWRESGSLPAAGASSRRKRAHQLQALVGTTANEPLMLDLRAHGPHALVGGTTGSGKSEFLQSWVMSLAATHSPNRVTFLFVDYKGGAAFGACEHLPHTVGMFTDLSPHLVRRALRSLTAELRHRERILRRHRAKDVIELERRGEPETPPSLVIMVDEFAALVAEVPEFVDGVVDIAQRGRSLGLHLVLATQRPAGVIRDNLRANTNLRIALRVADEADSDDVVGTKHAAMFDPGLPGRAIAKTGPGRHVTFQAAYVGGWTSDEPPVPTIQLRDLQLGNARIWDEAPRDDTGLPTRLVSGSNDQERLVDRMREAATEVAIEAPRKPWLPELAAVYDLARTPQSRTDEELIFAIGDDPDRQQQIPVAFTPDTDGNMCVIGTGGSGKSTFLRTIALAAGLSIRGGPCHVYGLDFSSRGLDMIEPLPHVGAIISGDDDERVARLLRRLRDTIDERAARYAAANAGSITEYRALADRPSEPRILLLLDGLASFRQSYEVGPRSEYFDMVQSIAAEGRSVGVHLVVTADRSAAIPSSLGSMIQRRLVLRLASDDDYLLADVPSDVLDDHSPPGRGFIDDLEVQVTVLGGSPNTAQQARAISSLASELDRTLERLGAEPVGRIPDQVRLDELPMSIDGAPVLGLADETLAPVGVELDAAFLVVGPPRSGKTTTLTTIAHAIRRSRDHVDLIYVGDGSSALSSSVAWDRMVTTDHEIEELSRELIPLLVAGDVDGGRCAFFLDDAAKLAIRPSDDCVVQLVEAAIGARQFVVADGETSAMGGMWPLIKLLKVARFGLALVPDQYDGEAVFKTPFPRIDRAGYPPGRGLLVRNGQVAKIQVATPLST